MIRQLYFDLLPHPLLMTLPFLAAALLLQRMKPGAALVERCVRLAPLVAALIFAALAVSYYTSFSFLDHVESQVASTAAARLHGGTIYHVMDGRAAYALGYGPLLYLGTELAYRVLGPSLLVAKSTTLLAALVSLGCCALVLRRRGDGAGRSLGTLLAAGLVPFGALVWLRADPLLMATASLGWLVADRAPRGLAQLLLGVLMGVAASLKLHGGLYLLPPLLWLTRRDGWKWTCVTPLLGGALALSPFLPWESFGQAYLSTLRVNAGHGLSLPRWISNVEFAVFLAAPLWLFWRSATSSPERKFSAAGLALAFLLVCTVASKPGAGNWHLLPLLPSVIILAASAARDTVPADWRRAAFAAWWGAALFLGWTRHDDWIAYLWRDPARDQIAELRATLAAHPGETIVLGAGDDAYGPGYIATYARSELALHGQPYLFDPCAIMDIRKAGYPDAAATPPGILDAATPPLVLIPHGERPFAMNNFYGGSVFPEEFQRAFVRSYGLRSAGRHFDLWAPLPAPAR